MSAERHQRVSDLFLRARRLAGAEREAMLDQACAGDARLRGEIESLLEHDQDASRFLEPPESGDLAAAAPASERFEAPADVGPFRVLGRIGEGGMGVVHRAEQRRPRRAVALKMMRSALPSSAARARFEREAELLGRLQHPNIAQVYDAGTTPDGRVYLAMEFVEGRPIDEFVRCESVDHETTLRLITQVCDAVHHAHQRGVIHRDLKPSNILVDDAARVRVLDFGVARAVEQGATVRTASDAVIGTPRFMSPEQLAGDPDAVDARADVYALGVLAYTLLARRHPIPADAAGLAEVACAVREHEPTRLGAIDRALRGDIETIVSKAMEKDPRRRYQSAAELGADIERFLNDEAVLARPTTTIYQLRKLARRRPGLVTGVGVGLVALVCITAMSLAALTVSQRAHAAREEALRIAQGETRRAERVLEFLQETLASADPSMSGADARMIDVLDSASGAIGDAFPSDPEAEASILHTLGLAYNSLGRSDAARQRLRGALELREARLPPSHPALLATLEALAAVAIDDRAWGEAQEHAERLVDSDSSRARMEGLRVLAMAHMEAGDLELAVLRAREATTMAESLLEPSERAAHMITLGQTLRRAGRPGEAAPHYAKAVALLTDRRGPEHDASLSARSAYAVLLRDLGRADQAERIYREVVDIRSRRFGGDHPTTLAVRNNLADFLSLQGRHKEAESLLERVHEDLVRTRGAEHEASVIALSNLAACVHRQQRLAEAAPMYERVLEWQARELGDDHPSTMNTMSNYARLMHRNGEVDESAALYERLCDVASDALPEGHWRAAAYSVGYAMTLADLGRHGDAERRLLDGYEVLASRLGAEHPYVRRAAGALAELYESQRKFDEAAAWRARSGRPQDPPARRVGGA